MKVTVDDRRRVVLPKAAIPGDVYDLEQAQGRFVLVRLEKPKPKPGKVKLVKHGGHLLIETDRVISREEIRKYQDEFP